MRDHRPRFHLTARSGWLNDPNGPIEWRGRYHLFFQHNPAAPVWGAPHWGHVVGPDLVRWDPLPVALSPSPGGPDAGGCWSGCAIDDGGVPTLVYTGVVARAPKGWTQTVCVARGDRDLATWRKDVRNPVIAGPPPDLPTVGFRDPYVWRDGDGWSMVIGSGIEGVGGAVLLYRSPDLVRWDYVGVLYARDEKLTDPLWTGRMWECPALFPLGDRHVLVISVHDNRRTPTLNYPVAFVGAYRGGRFLPERMERFDHGPDCYAPAVMADRRGRRLAWGWSWEGRDEAAQREQGWAGTLTVPRELKALPDGHLGIGPAKELAALRGPCERVEGVRLTPAAPRLDPRTRGDCLEIGVRIDPGTASAVVLEVGAALGGEETTRIRWDRAGRRLSVDRSRSSSDPRARGGDHGGAFELSSAERLDLRVLLDRSILEVFANGRFALTARIYPTRADSDGIRLLAEGGDALVESFNVWRLEPRA